MSYLQTHAMAKKRIEVNCPYCGQTNHLLIEIDKNAFIADHIHTCDLEDGGCDIPFVVTAKVSIEAWATRINWDKKDYPHIDNAFARVSWDISS